MNKGKNNLTRIPQAFSFDTDILSRAYDSQAPLIRDVLVFLANKTTSNFFNDVTFSLDDFCKAFGYNKQSMQRTLPQFVDCPEKKKPYAGGHCFDGEFEYALYKAFTTVLIFDRKRFKEDGFDLENMVLFSRIQAIYADTGRREKRHYLVELDYRIKQWQLDRFFLTDHMLYQNILIPRSRQLTGGLRSVYIN